jgi:hypothetical protein
MLLRIPSPTMIPDNINSSEKRPSITAEELTPIVLNQLQTATKLRSAYTAYFFFKLISLNELKRLLYLYISLYILNY